jgi:hypothetical protein
MIVLRVSAEKRPGTTHWHIVGCEINLHFWLHAGLDEGFSLPNVLRTRLGSILGFWEGRSLWR